MSQFDSNDAFSSPMEIVFSWATPLKSSDCPQPSKRMINSKDDSGYASPCSANKIRSVQSTPYRVVEEACTPITTGHHAKKRLTVDEASIAGENEFCYKHVAVPESYSDFLLDASLYSEPMELENSCISSSPDFKDALQSNEISRTFDAGLDTSSSDPCPTTPIYLSLQRKLTCSTSKKNLITPQSPRKRQTYSAPSQTNFSQKTKKRKYLTGFEKVDFLQQLGAKANYPGILSKIFSFLSDEDLSNMTMVSKTWKSVCLANSQVRLRWLNFADERKQNRENLPFSACNRQIGKVKRQSLRDNFSHHSTPLVARQPTSPPVSPSKFRFHMFQKEAKKLKDNEVLMECPRCTRPSACSPSLRLGECMSLFCKWKFCTVCKTEAHPRGGCPSLTPATPTTPTKRPTPIGSKQSRRNLKRL